MAKSFNKEKGKDVYFSFDRQDQYYVKKDAKSRNKYFLIGNNFLVAFKISRIDRQIFDNKITKRFMIIDSIGFSQNSMICFFEYLISDKYLKQKEYNIYSLKFIMEEIKSNLPNFCNKKTENLIKKELSSLGNVKQKEQFIHKDLGAFLNKELDNYIKDMFFDDLMNTKKKLYIER